MSEVVELPDVGSDEHIEQLLPAADAEVRRDAPLEFTFRSEARGIVLVRLEIRDATQSPILSAIVERTAGRYAAPPWLPDKISGKILSWRVVGLDGESRVIQSSTWRALKYAELAAPR